MICSKADTLIYFAACKRISERHAREKNGKRALSTTPHGAFLWLNSHRPWRDCTSWVESYLLTVNLKGFASSDTTQGFSTVSACLSSCSTICLAVHLEQLGCLKKPLIFFRFQDRWRRLTGDSLSSFDSGSCSVGSLSISIQHMDTAAQGSLNNVYSERKIDNSSGFIFSLFKILPWRASCIHKDMHHLLICLELREIQFAHAHTRSVSVSLSLAAFRMASILLTKQYALYTLLKIVCGKSKRYDVITLVISCHITLLCMFNLTSYHKFSMFNLILCKNVVRT